MSLPGYEPARIDAMVIGLGISVGVGTIVLVGIGVGGSVLAGAGSVLFRMTGRGTWGATGAACPQAAKNKLRSATANMDLFMLFLIKLMDARKMKNITQR